MSLPITAVLLIRALKQAGTKKDSEAVEIILSGSRAVLDQLTAEDLRVVLDLTDLPLGTFQIEPTVVTLPEEVTSESLLPATVEVQIQVRSTTS